MMGALWLKGLNQHIYVRKDHRPSMMSSSAALQVRSTPGSVPPDPLKIGSAILVRRRAAFGSASTTFKPSSISEVSVCPFSAALFLARRSKSSDNRTVVLICLDISTVCQYVKLSGSPAFPRHLREEVNCRAPQACCSQIHHRRRVQ